MLDVIGGAGSPDYDVARLVHSAIGYAVHYVFVLLLAGLVESSLPAPTSW